ncbi:SDR family oxidoreductase [Deinococcus navajonensis]|uniref:SDR family oxidoreductase n=1 Tax=Deinococcus navajonensis TaxID=309884 RepID=A0ABV8XLE7_9DEIO
MVITGASSGIGLSTARLAAAQGARLVLAARSAQALDHLVDELRAKGAQAVAVVTDVSRQTEVERLAQTALDTYGSFDTWVNNAGIGLYGPLEELKMEDMRRLFDVNFWGAVYGSRVAVHHLKQRGGALINIGSLASEQAIPLQGAYSASKHALKAYTDALRMELEHGHAPVSVTLIKPGPIDTPFPMNAHSELNREPQHVPPVYAPEVVARAILQAAGHPTRELFVGGGARGMAAFGQLAPGSTERAMAASVIPRTFSQKPPLRQDALYRASEALRERGDYPGHVQTFSPYTEVVSRPKGALLGILALGAAALVWRSASRPK